MLLFIAKWAEGCFKDPRIRIIPVVDEKNPKQFDEVNELLWIKRAGEPLYFTEYQFLQLLYQRFGNTDELDSMI